MVHIGEVIEVIEGPTKLNYGYKIFILAKNQLGQKFNYTFIKNDKEEVDKIITGYSWELGCRPFILK